MADPFFAPACYKGFDDFLRANPNRIYRYWIYRHGYTPYEQKLCFSDESLFEDSQCRYGVLREVIPLGSGNVLLGFAELTEDASEINEAARGIAYYRASDIRLTYMPFDADNLDPDGILEKPQSATDIRPDETYFRIQRDGSWETKRFSELSEEERTHVLRDWDSDALRRLCSLLADIIQTNCTRRYGNEVV